MYLVCTYARRYTCLYIGRFYKTNIKIKSKRFLTGRRWFPHSILSMTVFGFFYCFFFLVTTRWSFGSTTTSFLLSRGRCDHNTYKTKDKSKIKTHAQTPNFCAMHQYNQQNETEWMPYVVSWAVGLTIFSTLWSDTTKPKQFGIQI